MTLVVVTCGNHKIWDRYSRNGPVPAASDYIGLLFKVNKEFAERYGDRWVILSAKYGFMDLGFVILKNYSVTFKNPATGSIDVASLKEQVKGKGLDVYSRVIALSGKEYVSRIRAAFAGAIVDVLALTEGFPIGKVMRKMRELIAYGLYKLM